MFPCLTVLHGCMMYYYFRSLCTLNTNCAFYLSVAVSRCLITGMNPRLNILPSVGFLDVFTNCNALMSRRP